LTNQETNPLLESQASYAGGVNVAYPRHYRELQQDELAHGVNITVKNGWVENRPDFRLCSFKSDVGNLLELGKYQGGAAYGFADQTRFVMAFGGHLVSLNYNERTLTELSLPGGRPFSKDEPFVYFEQKDGLLLARDGLNPTVVIEGDTARFATITEVPRGLMMIDGEFRLVSIGRDRRSIFISDHEMDELTTSISFTDQNYGLTGATRILTPFKNGQIEHVAVIPWMDDDTGTGPVLVMGRNSTQAYDFSGDRSQWSISGITKTVLPEVGASGHRSGVARSMDYLWRDQNGRIRSFQNARQNSNSRNLNLLDRKVYPYYEHDSRRLLPHSTAANHDSRTLFTINPEIRHTKFGICNVRHRSIVALENDVALGYESTSEPVWAGIWTGIHPLDLISGTTSPSPNEGSEEVLLIPSHDDDGIIRFYEITRNHTGYDLAPRSSSNASWERKPIESIAVTRPLVHKNSLLPKKMNGFAFRWGDIQGRVPLQVNWIVNNENVERDWFCHEENAGTCLSVTCNGITPALPYTNMRVVSTGQDGFTSESDAKGNLLGSYYMGQIIFRWKGHARLEAWALDAEFDTPPTTTNTTCESGQITTDTRCPLNLYTYNALTAEPAVTEEETPACATPKEECESC